MLLTDTLPAEVEFARWVGDGHGAVGRRGDHLDRQRSRAGETITWTWQVTHTGGYGDVVTNTALVPGTGIMRRAVPLRSP